MKLGAKYEFFIHPKIAYGSRPRPTIPANSLLIFEVELLDIISNHFECNKNDGKEYLGLISASDLTEILTMYGLDEKKIRRFLK